MKTNIKKHNYFSVASWKNACVVFAVMGLLNSGDTAMAGTTTVKDTVEMVAGVPVKPEDISPLLIGEPIPMLQLPTSSGKRFDLNKSVAEKPAILVFYRGGWCPYCSKQLSGLQEIEQDLVNMGYQVIAVSTDSPENLNKTLNKQKLTYTLLSDADLDAAKKFGIAFKGPRDYDSFLGETSGGKNVNKLLPVPSVFIISRKGTILFEYINPDITQRVSASLLKAAAGALREEI
ncbi:peroxiredoxin [Chitinophaga sp. W3I9]|uniref:peroxiredoxin-like family protein n=1 Tax=Chitinophaga sp. W3I9 TaxID=3373924 RepID=UPI003D1980EF